MKDESRDRSSTIHTYYVGLLYLLKTHDWVHDNKTAPLSFKNLKYTVTISHLSSQRHSVMDIRPDPEIRGLFGNKGDSLNWLDAVSSFPNGVPRFEDKATCLAFMTEYNKYHGGSNPFNSNLKHIFTVLTSWNQIEQVLLPAIDKARRETSFAPRVSSSVSSSKTVDPSIEKLEPPCPSNIYESDEAQAVWNDIHDRLDLRIHQATNAMSTINTLKYLFYHMKCGIFVMIRDRKLRIFCPFVNTDYRNTWGHKLTIEGDGSLDHYYTQKNGQYREEFIENDKTKWWANGNIICNELAKPEDSEHMQYWGDHFLAPLRDMLAEACNQRQIPDCEIFLNKRDYPQLKINLIQDPKGVPVEPYGFIFDKDDRDPYQDVELASQHKFSSYAPIVSFYAAAKDRFADIPWPSSEDWEAACGLVFPNTFIHKKNTDGDIIFENQPRDLFTEANFRKFERAWDENRVATAFFRGTATGGGTTLDNNQRLKVAYLSHLWKDDPEKGGSEPFLDAAIVGWNLRDKKISSSPMTFLRPQNFPFTAGKHHFTPIYEQSRYKYLVYVDGHCAACRYGFMMRLGSVILKVESAQVADRMWYFPLLKPYVDHIPIKADLSDLEEKIRWCRQNDDKCRQMGENAKAFYQKYVTRDALLDYVEMVCKQVSRNFIEAPSWWSSAPPATVPPKLRKPDVPCFEDKKSHQSRLCVRCQIDHDEEERLIAQEQAQMAAIRQDAKSRKEQMRERMKKKARV